jgi:hypothetical protein
MVKKNKDIHVHSLSSSTNLLKGKKRRRREEEKKNSSVDSSHVPSAFFSPQNIISFRKKK